MSWFVAHWKDVVLVVLAIDSALIPIFPSIGILGKIKDFLSPIANKQA